MKKLIIFFIALLFISCEAPPTSNDEDFYIIPDSVETLPDKKGCNEACLIVGPN